MSNFALRFLVAAVGIPALLWCAVRGEYWLIALIAALQVLLLREWHRIALAAGVPLGTAALVIALIGVDVFVFGHSGVLATGVSLIAIYVWVLLVVFNRARKPLLQLGFGALFLIYAALPLALWLPLTELSDTTRHGALGALGVLLAATWLCDSAAYFGGKTFGKHKLFPQASPNKTVEGAVSGLFGAAMLLPVIHTADWAQPTSLDYVILPLTVGIAGQMGDLIESLMKREVQMKDTSQLIPGHGGFLDRFDSLLLASPLYLAYLYITTP